MQSELCKSEKNSINNNNNNNSNSINVNGVDAMQNENLSKEENNENLDYEDLENNYTTDSEDDQFINNSFSSPSNSGDENSRWYAYRGRLGINFMENNDAPINQFNNYPLQNENQQQINHNINVQQQQQEEDDFLEMDFEPDTEIENDNYGHNNVIQENQQHVPLHFNLNVNQSLNQQEIQNHNINFRNTGAKPKQFSSSSSSCRNIKSPKQNSQQISDGDSTFKITGHLFNNNCKSSSKHNEENFYNIGASCSHSLNSERPYHKSHQHDTNNYLKPHKSPSKSYSHNHKQQRLHEEQNDQFLFEIEPIKPRNSVTIYTSNCDEKILMDALMSLKLKPDREMIINYFNKSKISAADLGLIDYIIYRSKKNCNYMKLIELVENSCISYYHDEYGTKRFDINFYPLDFFSTTPEMIDIEVSEIVKRWTPQTDLTPLINIKNKYFIQTNVLGKLVNIIRRLNNNQKPLANIFRDGETIKIPQFYVSGYITVTARFPP